MTTFLWIITTTFLISLIAFVGAFALFLKEKILEKILLGLVSLSAGALLGGAFLHLLPESVISLGVENILWIFLYTLLGFCLFFILEQFLGWHHCHKVKHDKKYKIKPISYLILISDSFHNVIDGIVIAVSFIASVPLGIVTTLAIALHEIPQEIGDFGVLVYGGMEKKKALFLNFVVALTVILGGVIGYLAFESIEGSIMYLLPFAAGNFIYIASSDLIPEIKFKKGEKTMRTLVSFIVFLSGIGIMYMLKFLG